MQNTIEQPLTKEETDRLIRILGNSVVAKEASETFNLANEAKRAEILDSIPKRKAEADKAAALAWATAKPLVEEFGKLEKRLNEIRSPMIQAQCASSNSGNAAADIAGNIQNEARRLADPRIGEVLVWVNNCFGAAQNSVRFIDVLAKDYFDGGRYNVEHSNLEQVNAASDKIKIVRASLEQLQISKYDPAQIPEKLESAIDEVESALKTISGFTGNQYTVRPVIGRF